MKKTTKKQLKEAGDSLEDILKRIEPYLPKPRKAEEKPRGRWELISRGELPPLNTTEKI